MGGLPTAVEQEAELVKLTKEELIEKIRKQVECVFRTLYAVSVWRICMGISVFPSLCVCVCARETHRERAERDRQRQRQRQTDRESQRD
eukprot:COSAG03_NODE_25420_length_265_cov_1.777108_1_plen_88_part_11